MEQVYLDTTIYNDIIDKKISNEELDILKRAVGKKIEIIFSDLLLSELACTLESSTIRHETDRYKRTKELFKCALGIISKKIVKNWNILIREEIRAFLQKGEEWSVFYNEKQMKDFIYVMKKLAQGGKHYNKELLNNIHLQKRTDLEKQKKIFNSSTLKNVCSEYSNSNFELFYITEFRAHEEGVIKNLLFRTGINGNITMKVEEIRKNLEFLPHLKASLRIPAALCFSVIKENRKPKWGDKYDLYHLNCTSTLDLFISNELGILNIFRWVYNKKKCMDLYKLIKYLSNTKDSNSKLV